MKLFSTLVAIGLASAALAVPLPQVNAVGEAYNDPNMASEAIHSPTSNGWDEDEGNLERRADHFKYPPHEARPKIDHRPDKRGEDGFEERTGDPSSHVHGDLGREGTSPQHGGDGGYWSLHEGAGGMNQKRGWGGNQGPPHGYGNGGAQGSGQGPPQAGGQGFPQGGGQGFPQGSGQGFPQGGGQGFPQGAPQGSGGPPGGNPGGSQGGNQPSGSLQGMGETNQGPSDSGSGSSNGGGSSIGSGD